MGEKRDESGAEGGGVAPPCELSVPRAQANFSAAQSTLLALRSPCPHPSPLFLFVRRVTPSTHSRIVSASIIPPTYGILTLSLVSCLCSHPSICLPSSPPLCPRTTSHPPSFASLCCLNALRIGSRSSGKHLVFLGISVSTGVLSAYHCSSCFHPISLSVPFRLRSPSAFLVLQSR